MYLGYENKLPVDFKNRLNRLIQPQVLNLTVTNAATRVQFKTTPVTVARLLFIQANPGNGGKIFIGDKTVSSTVYGISLPAGGSVAIGSSGNDPTFDLSQFYADTSNSGDGFSVLYF